MQASMTINVNVFSVSANNAMIINNGHKISKNTTMTQPLRDTRDDVVRAP